MAGFDRDSTDDWTALDARLPDPPGDGDRLDTPPAPDPGAVVAAQRAASEAAACASRAAASSSAAVAAVERVERAMVENGAAVALAGEAAESAAQAAATASAIGENADKALERIEWQIDAVALSVDASAEYTEQVERTVDRANTLAEEGAARAVAAADQVVELSGRVEIALARLEARERATARRSEEAEREQTTLRSFTARADRIVDRLRDLEQRASPARVWRLPGDPPE